MSEESKKTSYPMRKVVLEFATPEGECDSYMTNDAIIALEARDVLCDLRDFADFLRAAEERKVSFERTQREFFETFSKYLDRLK